MGVSLQSDGTYRVSVHKRHPITRKPYTLKRIRIKTRTQAERIHRDLIIQLEDRIRKKQIPTWGAFLGEFEQSLADRGLKNATVYNSMTVLRAHTLDKWSHRLVDEIATEHIWEALRDKLGDKSESHKKSFFKYVRAAFQFALEKRYVLRNPTPVHKFKISEKIKAGLSEVQIKILLNKAQEFNWPWYPHYSMALFTGMRNGELYALTWDKVNLEARTIIVDLSWSKKDGYKSTKSGDDRILEIPNPLMPLLRELKLNASASIFVLPRLNKWDKGEQARELRLFLRANGLPEVRFHDLRASWATMLLSKGVAVSKVMAMGGWKDMETMMLYLRKAGIDIKGCTNVLDSLQTHGIEAGKVLEIRSL